MYIMKLDRESFQLTKAGKKVIEVRLNDKKRNTITKNSVIKFVNDELGEIEVKVVDIRKYEDIKELILHESLEKTGQLYQSIEEWENHILGYYSLKRQKKSGLLAIEISLI